MEGADACNFHNRLFSGLWIKNFGVFQKYFEMLAWFGFIVFKKPANFVVNLKQPFCLRLSAFQFF
jgi:hypothetical protein